MYKCLFFSLLAITIQTCNSQTNDFFKEYFEKSFKEVHLGDSLVSYYSFINSTTHCNAIAYGDYRYQQFIPKTMGYVSADTMIYTCIGYKSNNYYVTIFLFVIEDESVFDNNGGYYYFVIYDETGEIINSYKLLANKDQQWFENGVNYDSKLFISKDKIKYLLYGPYLDEMESNCLEEIYEITNKGSLEKKISRNYQARKKDQWNW